MEILTKYFPGLTQEQIRKFAFLKDLYADWNNKINVISRKDMEHFYEHHVLHSLSIAAQFSFAAGSKIMDLGTGGGFPGIPLAIFFPHIEFHLVDSIKKKIKVAGEVASAIGLSNVITQHARAEEIYSYQFDVIVSRAVAPLKELWKWSKPLLKNSRIKSDSLNGLICLKGGDLNQEISESVCNPQVYNIDKLFEEDFFKEKYILFVNA